MTACTAPISPCQENSERLERIAGQGSVLFWQMTAGASSAPGCYDHCGDRRGHVRFRSNAFSAMALARRRGRAKDFHRHSFCCIAALAPCRDLAKLYAVLTQPT